MKLLAVDLDGTLLTRTRTPHPESARALRRAADAGITVLLASGRIRTSMLPFAQELGLMGAMICSNGAHVFGPDGTEIRHHSVDPIVFKVVSEYTELHRVHLNIYAREDVYYLRETEFGELYRSRIKSVVPRLTQREAMERTEISKLLIVDHPENIRAHRRRLEPMLRELPVHITESEPEYLEFLSSKADKGAALRQIAETMNVAPANVAAIGDYLNDLEMLRFAGFSAAIGNAADEVKATAKYLVGTNEEGGVAEFVDSVLRNERE